MTSETIRVSGIIKESIVDGPGIRLVVFAQGCERDCPGCHNPETHPPDGGYDASLTDIIATAKENPLLRGLSFSGGEPFLQARAFAALARLAHAEGLDIVTFTGYTIEELIGLGNSTSDSVSGGAGGCADCGKGVNAREKQGDGYMELLRQTDILIDGPYMEELRTLDAPCRGSSNQRVIDVAATFKSLDL